MSATFICNKTLIMIICSLGLAMVTKAQNVNIPDPNFKAALVGNSNINTNGDSEIQLTEATAYSGWIDVHGLNIADLTGIETFPLIPFLDCRENNLTSINISANTALVTLRCDNNQLTTLDVIANTSLMDLSCHFNLLTQLNVSANTALRKLTCFNNQISSLDVSANTALEELYCNANQLTVLYVTFDNALTALNFTENQLTTIDVSNNPALTYFYGAANFITQLDLSSHPELLVVDCGFNLLTHLNITGDTTLAYLFCSGNQLTALDVSAMTHLSFLLCNENQITTLDLSANTSLSNMMANDNQLTSLNLQNANNTSITNYSSNNNPALFCIQVDDAAYSTANWGFVDPWSSFSTNCFTHLNEAAGAVQLSLYPNPCKNNLIVDVGDKDLDAHFTIYDATGKIILQRDADESSLTLNTENFAGGLYLARLTNKKGDSSCCKIVKE